MNQRNAQGTVTEVEGEESVRGASSSHPSLANDFGLVTF